MPFRSASSRLVVAALGALSVPVPALLAQQPGNPRGAVASPAQRGQAPVGRPAPAQGAATRAQPAPPALTPEQVAANQKRMDQLLAQWEARSSQITSLSVGLERVDKNPVWNDTTQYSGVALLKSPNLACLEFNKNVAEEGQPPKMVPHDRIVCTGKEVYQYLYDTKQIFIYPLAAEDRKRALEEGPLPFLFNMKAADAKMRYSMNLLNETDEFYMIAIVPRMTIDQESFGRAFVQLNKQTFLPKRLVLVAPNGKDTQDFTIKNIAANKEINPQFLSGGVFNGWKVVRNPKPEDVQRPAPGGAAAAARGVGQPIQPRARDGRAPAKGVPR